MTCTRCGAPAAADMTFCPSCGARLESAPSTEEASSPEAVAASVIAAAAAVPGSIIPTAAAAAQAGAQAGPAEQSFRHATVAVAGSLLFVLGFYTLVDLLGRASSFSILVVCLTLAVLPVPIYATVILSLDRHVRKPLWLRLAVFLWGALVATLFAAYFNGLNEELFVMLFGKAWAAMLLPPISGPLVEETLKGLAILLIFLFLRVEIDDMADGIVLGALVGLGFAMTENVGYFANAYHGAGLRGAEISFYMRAILGGFGHALYTGCTGAGFGLAAETRSPRVRVIAPIAGWFGAMFLHFSWNAASVLLPAALRILQPSESAAFFVLLPLMTVVLTGPGIITLLIIAVFAWHRETRVVTEQLRDEVTRGVVTAEEYDALSNDRRRAHRVWRTLFTHGPMAWVAIRRLYNEETALAFRKWHTARGERAPAYQESLSEDAFRTRIAALRLHLQHAGVPAA